MTLNLTTEQIRQQYPDFPLGAISGRTPDTPVRVAPGSSAAWRATASVRNHRRSGVERLELMAAGIGGALALALLLYLEKKVTGRG